MRDEKIQIGKDARSYIVRVPAPELGIPCPVPSKGGHRRGQVHTHRCNLHFSLSLHINYFYQLLSLQIREFMSMSHASQACKEGHRRVQVGGHDVSHIFIAEGQFDDIFENTDFAA